MVLAPILYRKFIYPGLKAGAIHIKSLRDFLKANPWGNINPHVGFKIKKEAQNWASPVFYSCLLLVDNRYFFNRSFTVAFDNY